MGSGKSPAALAKLFDVPEGYFHREHPQHRVKISRPFYLGITEVTQGQWHAVMGTEPWKDKELVQQGTEYPAVNVSWDDANDFCRALSAKAKNGPTVCRLKRNGNTPCRAGTTDDVLFRRRHLRVR